MGVLLGKDTAQWVVDQRNNQKGQSLGNRQTRTNVPAESFTFRNDSGEQIPAYGCMRVTSAEIDSTTGKYVTVVGKPNETGGPFLFNGSRVVESGGFGQYQVNQIRALFSSGTPATNEIWGPTTSWEITSFGSCVLTVFGSIESDLILGRLAVPTQISVRAPSGGIPARSGNQNGSATCDVLTTNASGETIDTGNTVTVWNQVKTIIMSNEDRIGKANAEIDYRWHGIVDDCSTGAT